MFLELLEKELNKSITENGAEGYSTTNNALVDFNFKLPSYRDNRKSNKMIADFAKAFAFDKELTLKYLFYMRDIREGIGERETFRKCIKEIASFLDKRVFDWIEEYGRLDDVFTFVGTCLEDQMFDWVQAKLSDDAIKMLNNKPCSLMAKWMPSINTSSSKTKSLAKKFMSKFNITAKDYRKTLAKLRGYLDVIERKTCSNKWDTINYSTVPSNAGLKYKDAFLKHDSERRIEYLNALKKGDNSVKINSKVLFPHEIVHSYTTGTWSLNTKAYDEALEQMWKNLPNYVNGEANILVVRDGSGSMTSTIPGSNITALDVSTGFAIYFCEKLINEFKNKFITFSSRPDFVNLGKLETLRDKLRECYKYDDCSNTDIEATFDLILRVAKQHNLPQSAIPHLLIISDMEFDLARGAYGYNIGKANKLFSVIKDKYNTAGYELPKLTFWNVNSRTNTIPLTQNELGVNLVSGFSPAIIKMVLSNELDPYKILVQEITKERYQKISLTV